jgi:hypothetical protein
MSGMGGGGGTPSFLQNSNMPSFNGPAASVAGAYGAMPGINASLFGGQGGPGQQPGGAPTQGGMPNVRMQPPGGPMPPQQMGGPQPGAGMPPIGMQRPGGPMPPQQFGGPSQQPGGGGGLPPGFNPAMLQALMAHMQGGGMGGGQSGYGGMASMMGGYNGAPSPMQSGGGMASMFPGMASRMGPMQPGGPQRQMPMNPGLLTR